MKRLRRFALYVLGFVACYLFVNLMSFLFIRQMYVDYTSNKMLVENPVITISDAKHTRVNGFVEGTIENTLNETIDGKYIKIAFYSKYGNEKITKFCKIEDLEPEEIERFKITYNAEDVESYTVELVDNVEEETIHKSITIDNENMIASFAAFVILAHFLY